MAIGIPVFVLSGQRIGSTNSGTPMTTNATSARTAGYIYFIFIGRATLDTHTPGTPVVTVSTGEVVSTVSAANYDNVGATQRSGFLCWFIASGPGTSFTVTATFSDSSNSNTNDFTVTEVSNVSTSQLAQALVSAVAFNTSWTSNLSTATLGGAVTAGNGTLAFHYGAANARTGTATSGWTALTQYNPGSTDRYLVEYKIAGAQTTSMDWGASETGCCFIVEVTVAPDPGPPFTGGRDFMTVLRSVYTPPFYVDEPMWGALTPETPGDTPTPRQVEWWKPVFRSWPPLWWPAQRSAISVVGQFPAPPDTPIPTMTRLIQRVIQGMWPPQWYPSQVVATVDTGGAWVAPAVGATGNKLQSGSLVKRLVRGLR